MAGIAVTINTDESWITLKDIRAYYALALTRTSARHGLARAIAWRTVSVELYAWSIAMDTMQGYPVNDNEVEMFKRIREHAESLTTKYFLANS